MIVISHGILSVWTCRIDEARAEPCARSAAATPSLLNNRHPASPAGGGGTCIEAAGASAPDSSLSPSTRALARRLASGSSESRRAAAEERERWRWGSGRDSCAWPCCPASSAWIQSSGNTWEASSTQKRWAFVPPPSIFNLLPCDNDPTARWQKRNRLDCESVRRCLFGGLFR